MQFPEPTLVRVFLSAFDEIWYLWVPLLLLLTSVGWATRRWWGGKVTLVSLLLLLCFVAKTVVRERAIERKTMDAWNAQRVPLAKAEKTDGLQFAAGTVVRWDSRREHLLTAELGAGQEVSPGIVLEGEVDRLVDSFWRGKLARPSMIRGWHCAAGDEKVDVHFSGQLRWCILEVDQTTPAGKIPKGTGIRLDALDGPSYVSLRLPDRCVRVSPGGFWIGAEQWFGLYADGELMSVPGPVTIRGVAFGEEGAAVQYGEGAAYKSYDPDAPVLARPPGAMTGWKGTIASEVTCEDGRTIDKGNEVTVPASGDVVTIKYWSSKRPDAKRVEDSLHCKLAPAP